MTCSVEGCAREIEIKSKGWCHTHWQRFYRHGDVNYKAKRETPDERFERQINKTESCWIWSGPKNELGYGLFTLPLGKAKSKSIRAHRWSYEKYVGKIPDGLVINHLCENPSCVNPEHLEACTQKENVHYSNPPSDKCSNGHLPSDRVSYCRPCNDKRRYLKRVGEYVDDGFKRIGSNSPNPKLTEEKVKKIKQHIKDGKKYKYIAEEFDISMTTISNIKHGKLWSHV